MFLYGKGKENNFSFKENINILEVISVRKKQVDVMKVLEIATSILAIILNEKGKIMNLFEGFNMYPDRKQLHLGDYQITDEGRVKVI